MVRLRVSDASVHDWLATLLSDVSTRMEGCDRAKLLISGLTEGREGGRQTDRDTEMLREYLGCYMTATPIN